MGSIPTTPTIFQFSADRTSGRFFRFGADFEAELVHLQRWRESTVFAFSSVFAMISRQILWGAEVAGFSIGEAKVGETHKKSDLLIFGIEKRDSPLAKKYVVID